MYWGSWEPVRFSETSRLEERVSSSGCEAKVAWDISKPSLLRVRSEAAGVEKGAKGLEGAILCEEVERGRGRQREVDRYLGVKVRPITCMRSWSDLLVAGVAGGEGGVSVSARVYRSANDAGQ